MEVVGQKLKSATILAIPKCPGQCFIHGYISCAVYGVEVSVDLVQIFSRSNPKFKSFGYSFVISVLDLLVIFVQKFVDGFSLISDRSFNDQVSILKRFAWVLMGILSLHSLTQHLDLLEQ